jgi:hypothetical protein
MAWRETTVRSGARCESGSSKDGRSDRKLACVGEDLAARKHWNLEGKRREVQEPVCWLETSVRVRGTIAQDSYRIARIEFHSTIRLRSEYISMPWRPPEKFHSSH